MNRPSCAIDEAVLSPARALSRSDVLSAEAFNAVFRTHPAGVTVVTADDGTRPIAMTVSSMSSVSASPPLLVFSTSALSSSTRTRTLCEAKTVVVHLLGAEQLELAQLCATSGRDRFDGSVEYGRLPTGEPFYPGVPTWIRGRVVDRVSAGSSNLFVIEALEAKSRPAGSSADNALPLVYHNRTWHVLDENTQISTVDS